MHLLAWEILASVERAFCWSDADLLLFESKNLSCFALGNNESIWTTKQLRFLEHEEELNHACSIDYDWFFFWTCKWTNKYIIVMGFHNPCLCSLIEIAAEIIGCFEGYGHVGSLNVCTRKGPHSRKKSGPRLCAAQRPWPRTRWLVYMYVAFDPIANRIIDMDSLHLHSLGGENTSLGDSLKFQGMPSHIQFFDYLHMKEPWWVVLNFQILSRSGLIMESKGLGPNSKLGYHLLCTKATLFLLAKFLQKAK